MTDDLIIKEKEKININIEKFKKDTIDELIKNEKKSINITI